MTAFEVLDPHHSLTVTASATVHTDRSPAGPPVMRWEEHAQRRRGRPAHRVPRAARAGGPARGPRAIGPRDRRRERPPRARRRARSARSSTARSSTSPGRPRSTPSPPTPGPSGRACARTWPTSRSVPCARSASPRATSRATCTRKPEPVVGEPVSGESHAWVEWWDDGWRGFDPTNDTEPGDRHVIVATGPRLQRREAALGDLLRLRHLADVRRRPGHPPPVAHRRTRWCTPERCRAGWDRAARRTRRTPAPNGRQTTVATTGTAKTQGRRQEPPRRPRQEVHTGEEGTRPRRRRQEVTRQEGARPKSPPPRRPRATRPPQRSPPRRRQPAKKSPANKAQATKPANKATSAAAERARLDDRSIEQIARRPRIVWSER